MPTTELVPDLDHQRGHDDEYVDETGDVKSHHAQRGDESNSAKSPMEKKDDENQVQGSEVPGQEVESSTPIEASETREISRAEQLLIDSQLGGIDDSLSDLNLLVVQAQSHLSTENSANLAAMAQSYEKDRSELVRRILNGEDVNEDIDNLNQRIKNQFAFGDSQLTEAEAADANEDNRHGAEVAGRTVVANYEARIAVGATQNMPQERPTASQQGKDGAQPPKVDQQAPRLSFFERRRLDASKNLMGQIYKAASELSQSTGLTEEERTKYADDAKRYGDAVTDLVMGSRAPLSRAELKDSKDTLKRLEKRLSNN